MFHEKNTWKGNQWMYTYTEILNKSPIQNFEIYPLFATVKVKSKVKLRGIISTQETKWYLNYYALSN